MTSPASNDANEDETPQQSGGSASERAGEWLLSLKNQKAQRNDGSPHFVRWLKNHESVRVSVCVLKSESSWLQKSIWGRMLLFAAPNTTESNQHGIPPPLHAGEAIAMAADGKRFHERQGARSAKAGRPSSRSFFSSTLTFGQNGSDALGQEVTSGQVAPRRQEDAGGGGGGGGC